MTSWSALPRQSDFSGSFTLVAVHDFHIALRGSNTLVSHHALNGTDICPAAACKVANVLRYEWKVMSFVIPAERIHSFIGCCVQLRFSPLKTSPVFSEL